MIQNTRKMYEEPVHEVMKRKGVAMLVTFALLAVVGLFNSYPKFLADLRDEDSLKRCKEELKSSKRHLEAYMDSKERSDNLVADMQKHHASERERLRDVMEKYYTLTQRSAICEYKLEELQIKCKKPRIGFVEITKAVDPANIIMNFSATAMT